MGDNEGDRTKTETTWEVPIDSNDNNGCRPR